MGTSRDSESLGLRHLWGIILVPISLFVALSLFSYDWKDISLLRAPPNDPPCNLIGPVGAWLSYILFTFFGVGAYLLPLACLGFGLILILDREERVWPRGLCCLAVTFCLVAAVELQETWWTNRCVTLNIADAGGLLGRLVVRDLLVRWLSPVGTGIVVWTLFAISFVLMIEIHNLLRFARAGWAGARALAVRIQERQTEGLDRREVLEKEQRKIEKRRQRLERELLRSQIEPQVEIVAAKEPPAPAPVEPEPPKEVAPVSPPPSPPSPPSRPKPAPKPAPAEESEPEPTDATAPERPKGARPYALPPISLLNEAPASATGVTVDTSITSRILVETLAEFGIEVEVTNVERGPTVTRYEMLPAPGVRVERIAGLSNNLALALKATSVRVQAPVPGKGVVGVEVPNSVAKMVVLREILAGKAWQTSKARLPLVLGKDVGGNDIVADLADMPHLLVAGATGSGKTVCMNSILAGLLMSRTPEQLRLLLIDPKIVEFSVFNQMPHLVVPVITDPHKVPLGLRWAINEMEKRYKLFAATGVRNIESYNNREIARQEDLFAAAGGAEEGEKDEPPERLAYIVIVIDELADLMLAAQAEIENGIARLAQLSRAVGIHMILSTQRPSVNVITGTIKANFPARIAFQVAQKVDSRTILDTVGADKLLGRGDMLFLPPGTSKLVRAQGTMTSDEEIRRIVEFIKNQAEPSYEVEIKERIEKPGSSVETGDEEDEEVITQAVAIIKETQRASTSSLQRRLRIGYTRAARVMDILEERGIVGPPRGSDPREILIDLDGAIPQNSPEQVQEE